MALTCGYTAFPQVNGRLHQPAPWRYFPASTDVRA